MDIVCSQVDQTYTISVKTVVSGYWFTTVGTNDEVLSQKELINTTVTEYPKCDTSDRLSFLQLLSLMT